MNSVARLRLIRRMRMFSTLQRMVAPRLHAGRTEWSLRGHDAEDEAHVLALQERRCSAEELLHSSTAKRDEAASRVSRSIKEGKMGILPPLLLPDTVEHCKNGTFLVTFRFPPF